MSDRSRVISPEGSADRDDGRGQPPARHSRGQDHRRGLQQPLQGRADVPDLSPPLKRSIPASRSFRSTSFPIVYVGGDAASQKKIAKEIAAIAKEKGCRRHHHRQRRMRDVHSGLGEAGRGGRESRHSQCGRSRPPASRPSRRAAAKAEGMTKLRVAEYPGAVGVHAEELVVEERRERALRTHRRRT